MENYLAATYYFDFEHSTIQAFVGKVTNDTMTKKEKAIALYYAVRDGWFYNAYQLNTEKKEFRSSFIATKEQGHCIDKATLLISCLRSVGIPARLHLVKVKNHIAAEKIIERFGTDELTPHAFVEMHLADKWVGATPAFNRALCEKLNVDPLDFDGVNNSLFQAFSRSGGKFMEYLADYGFFDDIPFDFIRKNMIEHYPGMAAFYANGKSLDLS
ncbi:MAG: transglutaminase family protein [Saprospiraceae bacterium]|nr:transglutaminase family protein [Saprospiraceae bacterium]